MSKQAEQRRRRIHARGLTLVELIIVITIIGGLMGVIAFAIFSRKASAEKGIAKQAVDQFRQAASLYQDAHKDIDCPTAEQIKAESTKDKIDIKDPWGQVYVIKCEGENIVVLSKGPDKKEGTDDDIRSDKEK